MSASRIIPAHFKGMSDRRGNSRFPVREEVRYRLLRAKSQDIQGTGKTIDMSSGGVFFATKGELPHGRLVEFSVNWPARLGGVCPLQFVAVGRVVRSDGAGVVVSIKRYQFKTRKATA
jgi:glycine/D-amino acid oxidase-like deaminating enzyme